MPVPDDLLRIEPLAGAFVVTPNISELRSGTIEDIRSALLTLVDSGARRIILNLEPVRFVDSSALGLIVQLGAKLSRAGWRLQLCGVRLEVRPLFTGPPLLPLGFPLFTDAQAAITAVHAVHS